jgi:DNA-binding SARP family transcriptional activator/TolB-like protein
MARVLLRLLGGARIEVDDMPFGGRAAHRRRVGLLAVLAASAPRPISRERLVALFWPEHSPEAARRLLSESLYVLRREFGDTAILSTADELRLNTDVIGSDLAMLREALARGDLERAVATYAGDFLDGWFIPDTPELERWIEEERAKLGRVHLEALQTLAERDELLGSWEMAVSRWREISRLDPYSSRVTLRLARALAATGEPGAALQAIAAHESILRADLDVAPDAELAAFRHSLRLSPESSRMPAGTPSTKPLAQVTRVAPPTPRDDLPNAASAESVSDVSEPSEVTRVDAPATSPHVSDRNIFGGLRRNTLALVALLAAVVVTATAVVASRSTKREPERVAVLYFDDLSPRRDIGYLADGLTDQLIHELTGVNAFRVVTPNAARLYRGRGVPFDSIGRAFGARYVVTGSVERSGDQLKVTVGLIDAPSNEHLHSKVIERPWGELFALESDLALEVAAALRRRMGREVRLREVGAGTRSTRAREYVLMARQELERAEAAALLPNAGDVQLSVAALRRADSLLVLAQSADSRWLRPTVERGWVAQKRGLLEHDAARVQWFETALRFADEALRQDARNAGALELRGTLNWGLVAAFEAAEPDSNRISAAERDLTAATTIDSTAASAWATLGYLLWAKGDFLSSYHDAERALQEDAYLDGARDIHLQLFYSALMLEHFDTAAEWCERGRALYPEDWRFVECELTRQRHNVKRRADPQSAWAIVRRLDEIDPASKARSAGHPYSPIYRRVVAAAISARAGDTATARTEVNRATSATAGDTALRLDLAYDEAYVRLLLGERSRAIGMMRGLVRARPVLRLLLEKDPLWRDVIPRY